MILILTVMRYLDLENSGSGIRSELLINFCRLLTITSFRSPCTVLQFLPACPSQPLSSLAFLSDTYLFPHLVARRESPTHRFCIILSTPLHLLQCNKLTGPIPAHFFRNQTTINTNPKKMPSKTSSPSSSLSYPYVTVETLELFWF